MIGLANIENYVEKLAFIMSKVLEMDVLICDERLRILGEYEHNGHCCKTNEIKILQPTSVISKAIIQGETVVYTNAKKDSEGCISCLKKDSCRTESIIALPISKGEYIYGGIGIYSQEVRQKQKLIEEESVMLDFIENIRDLILGKIEEEERQDAAILKKANELIKPINNSTFDDIIGDSKLLRRVKDDAKIFANSYSSILIQGESGTGKEIFANGIHQNSKCSKGPFVAVNCAAIPDNLIESELFGYVEGSFTGAIKGGRAGKFEIANNGTLFLDEIGELPIHLQPKLLRAIQEKKIQRVGSNEDIKINIRIISATNRNLQEMIETGEFREDLYYRLGVIPIQIPPLRERKEDIFNLLDYFLNMYKLMLEKDHIQNFDQDSKNLLLNYSWPGNVRELQNVVEYAVNKCGNKEITIEDLPVRILNINRTVHTIIPIEELEKQAIREALKHFDETKEGRVKVAQALGISRATLYRKIKDL